MDPVRHSDLRTVLAHGGPLDPARAVNVLRQLAVTIDQARSAHTNRTVHRVITPSTILLGEDDSAYLADEATALPSTEQTRALVLGAATDTEANYRADIYALAAVLYECLTGYPPDATESTAPIPRPSQQRAGIPVGFDDVIARGMAVNADDGYRSAAELAAAAQLALTAAPHRGGPSTKPTSPDAPLPGPSDAVTRTIQLPQAPVTANPTQPPFDPVAGRNPTVSYPYSRPVPLPVLPPQRRRRHIAPAIAIVFIVGAVVAGAIAIPRFVGHRASSSPTPATTDSARQTYNGKPTDVPFPGLDAAKSLAVDGAGDVFVLSALIPPQDANPFDSLPSKLFKLASGATKTTTLEFPDLNFRAASDLAADPAGNIYFSVGAQVWELEAGASIPIRLPFRGFVTVAAIAVDTAGNVYATGSLLGDKFGYGVKKLVPGDNKPTEMSFKDLYLPRGLAVNRAGDVYVCAAVENTGRGQVLRLPAGATAAAPLPISDLVEPRRMAFDAAGSVFISDFAANGIVELPAGSTKPVKVPISAHTSSVAIDSGGNLYFTTLPSRDKAGRIVEPGRVLKVAPDK
ncbi:MAG: serine/threonine protein kinase, bacterial [Mycobacterium sp.]|nr:serine/threonine protein kinase, bacterial [Mycobacterium sp.]